MTLSVSAVGANTWHRRLGHPNEAVIYQTRNIADSGVWFSDSSTSCDVCRLAKSTQQPHPQSANSSWITESLQLVSADLIGPIFPKAIGGFSYVGKYNGVSSRFTVVYLRDKLSSSRLLAL